MINLGMCGITASGKHFHIEAGDTDDIIEVTKFITKRKHFTKEEKLMLLFNECSDVRKAIAERLKKNEFTI
jgi:hypothetical protein